MTLNVLLMASIIGSAGGGNNLLSNNNERMQTMAEEENLSFIKIGEEKYKLLESDSGYLLMNYEILKSSFTNNSSLYLLHSYIQATPGHEARKYDLSYKDTYLSDVMYEVGLRQYNQDDELGGKINIKSFWPKSSTFTTTLTSSFGGSINVQLDKENSLQLGNGGSIGTKEGASFGLSLNFSQEQSTVSSDPVLSAQNPYNDLNKAKWSMSFKSLKNAGSATYTLDSYILFEMEENTCNLLDPFYLDFNFSLYTKKLLIFNIPVDAGSQQGVITTTHKTNL